MINPFNLDYDPIWLPNWINNNNSKKLRKGPRFTKQRKKRASYYLNLFIFPDLEETYTIGSKIINHGI